MRESQSETMLFRCQIFAPMTAISYLMSDVYDNHFQKLTTVIKQSQKEMRYETFWRDTPFNVDAPDIL